MNNVTLMGRLTRDPELRYGQGENPLAICRYTLAVNRPYQASGEQKADFISCIEFGKMAEFAEKYFRQGMKIAVTGRIQTGSYTDKNNVRKYTTDVIISSHEFAESKREETGQGQGYDGNGGSRSIPESAPGADGFSNIPDGFDEELPFN